MFTPFLPHSAQQVHQALGGTGVWAAQPEIHEVDDLDSPDRRYPILTATTSRTGPLGVHADRDRQAAGQADAAVPEARPVARRDRTGLRTHPEVSARQGELPPVPEPLSGYRHSTHTRTSMPAAPKTPKAYERSSIELRQQASTA